MSAITGTWDEEKVREVIGYLDEKTGLIGTSLPITFGHAKTLLGKFYAEPGKERFHFSLYYLDDPNFRESEAIELIRHLYANYYVYATNLRKYFPVAQRAKYDRAWRYACRMVGANGKCTYKESTLLKELSEDEVLKMLCAEDIPNVNIVEHIMKNGYPPII